VLTAITRAATRPCVAPRTTLMVTLAISTACTLGSARCVILCMNSIASEWLANSRTTCTRIVSVGVEVHVVKRCRQSCTCMHVLANLVGAGPLLTLDLVAIPLWCTLVPTDARRVIAAFFGLPLLLPTGIHGRRDGLVRYVLRRRRNVGRPQQHNDARLPVSALPAASCVAVARYSPHDGSLVWGKDRGLCKQRREWE
jgi:hypothetical protein